MTGADEISADVTRTESSEATGRLVASSPPRRSSSYTDNNDEETRNGTINMERRCNAPMHRKFRILTKL